MFMTKGLRKIYLHHSFFGAVLTELECESHTNVTGDNAAGKTTLLSLIPVFYGLEPNKVVSRAAEKSDFLGHYLPSAHSMIVFEYEREDGICCAIIFRNTQQKSDSISYRFVTGAADDTLFDDAMLKTLTKDISVKEWLRDIVSQSFPVSLQLNACIDYRAIIQNDKTRTRARRKNGHGLMLAASKYSLCNSDTQMKHIDSLSSVLISKGKLLSRFKTMVVDSFLSDQISIGAVPFRKTDREYIDSLQALVKLNDRQKDFDEAIQSNVNLKDAWSTLIGVKNALEVADAKITNEHKVLVDKADIIKKELSTKKVEHTEKSEKLESALMSLNSRILSLEQQIEVIHSDRYKWDDQVNISAKMADFNNLSSFIEKAEEDKTHYAELLAVASKEEAEHKADMTRVENKLQSSVIRIRDKIEAEERLLQGIIGAENDEVARRKEKFHAGKDDFIKERTALLETLNLELIQLSRASASALSLTTEETTKVYEVDAKLEEVDDLIESIMSELRTANSDVNAIKQRRTEANELLNRKTNNLSAKRKQREELLALISPKDNTLRSFLNENMEDWNSTIGKVIRPELLSAKGLEPQISDDKTSLLGLQINLSNTDVPEYSQKNDVLEQRRAAIEKDIFNLEAEITSITNKMKSEAKVLQEAENLVYQLDSKIKNATDNKKSIGLRKRNLLSDIENNKSERAKAAKIKLDRQQAKIEQHRKETEEAIEKRAHEHGNDIIQYKAFKSSERSECNDKIEALKEHIIELKKSSKLRGDDLKAAFKAVLEKKGVDPRKESEAKKRKDESQSKVNQVKLYAVIIDEYRAWNKNQWANVELMETDLSERKVVFSEDKRKLDEYQKQAKLTLSILKSQKNEIDDKIAEIESIKKKILDSLNKIASEVENAPIGHPANTMDEDARVDELISIANAKATDARDKVNQIRKLVQKVDAIIFETDIDNKIYATWKEIKAEVVSREGFEQGSEKYYLRCLEELTVFLSETLPNIRQLTLESIRTVGEQYIRFYQSLDTLNRKIASVSKKLESSIKTANKFPALDNIRVRLESKIQDFKHFGELKLFNSAWNDWGEKGRNTLPDTHYISAFSDAIDALKSGGMSNTLESLVDINISLTENGREVLVRCDEDLTHASSQGVSTLAVCVVFCGMTRFLCSDDNINIHWPFDELGSIDQGNIILLFEFMNENNITLFCAQPNLSVMLMRYFPTKVVVEYGVGAKRYTPRKNKTKNMLLEMAGDK
jgi:hypothetical protein